MRLVRGSLPWRPAWSLAPQTAGLLRAICSRSRLCLSFLLSRLADGSWAPFSLWLSVLPLPLRGLHHVTPHQPPGSELWLGLESGFVLRPLLHPPTSSPPSGRPPALFPCLHSCDCPRPCPPFLPPAESWGFHKASPLPFPQEPARLPFWPRAEEPQSSLVWSPGLPSPPSLKQLQGLGQQLALLRASLVGPSLP